MIKRLIKKNKFAYSIAVRLDAVYRGFRRKRLGTLLVELAFRYPLTRISYALRCIDLLPSRKHRPLKQFAGIHKGGRCFIVCTGPSLKFDDLEKLKNEICFSKNSIVKLFDKTSWRPRYITASASADIMPHIEKAAKKGDLQTIFIHRTERKYYSLDNSVMFAHPEINSRLLYERKISQNPDLMNISDRFFKFSGNLYRGLSVGATSTNIILQIAVYMGFEEIYLLGCDNDFKGHLASIEYGGQFDLPEDRRIHEKRRTDIGFIKAKEYARGHGIKIYNATRGGALEIFERVDLDKVLESTPEGTY
ncbi:MAG: DUF115 domain-containing protein [Oscillospiraceae bacterium]|nr:DUF115 domain-containing protein [Oscillospiraceae bacterium]